MVYRASTIAMWLMGEGCFFSNGRGLKKTRLPRKVTTVTKPPSIPVVVHAARNDTMWSRKLGIGCACVWAITHHTSSGGAPHRRVGGAP